MKKITILTIAFILAACQPAGNASPSPTPTETAVPTLAPSPTVAATPAGQEFIFAHFDYLSVFYDPAAWLSDRGGGQGFLIHQQIPNCQISDQHPEAMPAVLQSRSLGELAFKTARIEDTQTGAQVIWYLLDGGLERLPEGESPFAVVTAPLDDPQACIQAAEDVLKSLHPSGV